VVRFLSDAWVARIDDAARAANDLAADPPFTVETVVQGADGDAGYRVRFGPEGATVGRPGGGSADVVLVTDLATAWALHQGEVRAQEAFARGALKVRGRPELLATQIDLLAALDRALAPVRAGTTPPDGTSDPSLFGAR